MAENDVGSQVLTDTILDELSKVSEIEKMVFKVQDHSYFTSSEVHSLEARVDGLQEKVDEKESTTLDGDRKYGDNVTSDKDKINPILKTDERKRYENIGVEFAIGAERVFNELKKAEELKEKMRIKKIENIDVEQEQKKEKDEKKSNKMSSIWGKIAVVLGVIGTGLLYVSGAFDSIIDTIKNKLFDNKYFQRIKEDAGFLFDKVVDTIMTNVTRGTDIIFGALSEGTTLLFQNVIPNLLLKMSHSIIEKLGGTVDASVDNQFKQINDEVNKSLEAGKKASETDKEDIIKRQFELGSALSTDQQFYEARQYAGLDSLMLADKNLSGIIAKSIEQNNLSTFQAYEFMSKLKFDKDNNLKMDKEEMISLYKAITRNNDTEAAERWVVKQTTDGGLFKSNVENLKAAYDKWTQSQELIEMRRRNKEKFVEEETVKKVQPSEGNIEMVSAKIAQDAFVSQLQSFSQMLSNVFKGNFENGGFVNTLLNGAHVVASEIFQGYLKPMLDIFNKIKIFSSNQNTQVGSQNITFGGSHTDVTINLPNNSQVKPVVAVINFDLSSNVANVYNGVVDLQLKLSEQMQKTNEQLDRIRGLIVYNPDDDKDEKKIKLSDDETMIGVVEAVQIAHSRLDTIEKYLEDTDDDSQMSPKNFIAQAQSIAS